MNEGRGPLSAGVVQLECIIPRRENSCSQAQTKLLCELRRQALAPPPFDNRAISNGEPGGQKWHCNRPRQHREKQFQPLADGWRMPEAPGENGSQRIRFTNRRFCENCTDRRRKSGNAVDYPFRTAGKAYDHSDTAASFAQPAPTS